MLLQDTSGIAQGISTAGGALAQALEKSNARNIARQQASAFGSALGMEGDELEGFSKLGVDQQKMYTTIASERAKTGLPMGKFGQTATQDTLKNTISKQLELIEGGYTGVTTGLKSIFDPETRRGSAEFDSLKIPLEKELIKAQGKGTMNKERFNFVLKNLPDSRNSDAKNIGILQGLSRELGVEIPGLQDVKLGIFGQPKDVLQQPGQTQSEQPESSKYIEEGEVYINNGKKYRAINGKLRKL